MCIIECLCFIIYIYECVDVDQHIELSNSFIFCWLFHPSHGDNWLNFKGINKRMCDECLAIIENFAIGVMLFLLHHLLERRGDRSSNSG
jgi:hypothetical protein